MARIAYVNGRYVPHGQARVHIEDRGYQFADGVYEVMAVRDGVLIDLEAHNDRLERSLSELQIAMPMRRAALSQVMRETVRRNRVGHGIVYLQITRGVARIEMEGLAVPDQRTHQVAAVEGPTAARHVAGHQQAMVLRSRLLFRIECEAGGRTGVLAGIHRLLQLPVCADDRG